MIIPRPRRCRGCATTDTDTRVPCSGPNCCTRESGQFSGTEADHYPRVQGLHAAGEHRASTTVVITLLLLPQTALIPPIPIAMDVHSPAESLQAGNGRGRRRRR